MEISFKLMAYVNSKIDWVLNWGGKIRQIVTEMFIESVGISWYLTIKLANLKRSKHWGLQLCITKKHFS